MTFDVFTILILSIWCSPTPDGEIEAFVARDRDGKLWAVGAGYVFTGRR
jgi:hypothetical protein